LGNIINDGIGGAISGESAYYNLAGSGIYSGNYTFNIYADGGIAGYNPPGTALVSYTELATGQTVTETFYVGGGFGPSQVTIQTGSIYPTDSIGNIEITVLPRDSVPGLVPGIKQLGDIGKILKAAGYFNSATDGVFGVYNFEASLLSSNITEMCPSVDPDLLNGRAYCYAACAA